MTPPDRIIEKLVLGELDSATAAALREDPEVRALEAALRQSNEEILRAYPPEVMARRFRPRRPYKRMAGVAALAFAALLFWQTEDTERSKGSPTLAVWRKTKGEPQRLADGAKVKAGDVLQLTYSAKGAAYGAIASADGRGEVTWHMRPQPLKREPTALPEAYELDDAPQLERFLFFTASRPFSLDDQLKPPKGVNVTTVTVVKE